ncbi:hypothetical protein HK098_002069 [Nowakowskiella sp. JEL0407]|nr:hypothetical protein HK098_002069 [Nowakowskiella sp. JEL0407]
MACKDPWPVSCPNAPPPFNCMSAGSTCCPQDKDFGACLSGFTCSSSGCVISGGNGGGNTQQSPPAVVQSPAPSPSGQISSAIKQPTASISISDTNITPTPITTTQPQETNLTPIIIGSVLGALAVSVAIFFFIKFTRGKREQSSNAELQNYDNRTLPSIPSTTSFPTNQYPNQQYQQYPTQYVQQQQYMQQNYQYQQPQQPQQYLNYQNGVYAQPSPNLQVQTPQTHTFDNVDNVYVNSSIPSGLSGSGSNGQSDSSRVDENKYLSRVPS